MLFHRPVQATNLDVCAKPRHKVNENVLLCLSVPILSRSESPFRSTMNQLQLAAGRTARPVARIACSRHQVESLSRASRRTHVPEAYKKLGAASAATVLGCLLAAGVVAASEAGEQHQEPMQLLGQACLDCCALRQSRCCVPARPATALSLCCSADFQAASKPQRTAVEVQMVRGNMNHVCNSQLGHAAAPPAHSPSAACPALFVCRCSRPSCSRRQSAPLRPLTLCC